MQYIKKVFPRKIYFPFPIFPQSAAKAFPRHLEKATKMRITIFAVLRDFEVPESMPLSTVHDEVYRSLGDTAEAQRQARNVYIVRCRSNADGSPATFQEFDRAPPLNQCIREAMEHYSLAHGRETPYFPHICCEAVWLT